ncbi:MAG TPA: hydrogenase maturation nickel metallochaperone HypA [Polyangiaceae bacterium]|jgi:hydrogenase nickel incorporation protein HypA/HybF
MHELSVAMEVVELVTARAAGARVKRVVVEVGALAAILPDALAFSFQVASDGTSAAGAELQIIERDAQGRCRSCQRESAQRDILASCVCGERNFDWLSGAELKIREMEIV